MLASYLAPAIGLGGPVLAGTSLLGDRPAQYALVIAQTASLVWLARLGWSRTRSWATAAVFVAAAWVPTFLVASWIYAIDPSLLDVAAPTASLALVDLSLLALIAGFLLWPRRASSAGAAHVEVAPAQPDRRTMVAWSITGLAGLAVVFQAAGGPLNYLRNINHEGSLTQGKTYFVVLALAFLYVAQLVVYLRWSRGLRMNAAAAAGLLAAMVLVGVLGTRLVLAVALAQMILFHSLTRPRLRLRVLALPVLAAALVITLVVGAVKRYSSYQSSHPHTTLVHYLTAVAPGQIPVAFANNYADGVRLMALSVVTVPRHADYEYGKEALRLLIQPLPHSLRPVIEPAPGLKAALYPGGGYVYAQPVQVVSYLQFGLPGVVLAFVLLGVLVAEFDFRLAVLRRIRPSTLVLITAVIVEVLATLRGASSPSDAFAVSTLLVMYAVSRTSERLLPERSVTDGLAGSA
ncbi:MAG: hypothetical protein ACR2KV_10320 [Solirubrobacteraceae bacterium]